MSGWFRLRCPACGEGKLYRSFLTVADSCSNCGLPLKKHDAADGPAYVVMVIMSLFAVIGALWVEFTFNPPFWVHIILWIPLTLGGSLLLLRYVKAWFIHTQYRHNAQEFNK